MEISSVITLYGITGVVCLVCMECEVMKGLFRGSGIGNQYSQASGIIDEIHTDNGILCARACLHKNCAAFLYRESDTVVVDDHCHDSSTASGYIGHTNTTIDGRACQRWDSQYPHGHYFYAEDFTNDASLEDAKNYCRSPDSDTFVWCFTADPNKEWEYCDVVKCMEVQYNCRLYNMTTTPYRTINGLKYFVRETSD